jgi:hypothetical protein
VVGKGGPEWQGWGNEPLRRSMGRGGDGLRAWLFVALVFGVPGVLARSWVLMVVGGIGAVLAGFAIATRMRNR